MLNDTRRGPRQAELFAAMRAYTFEVQGATRSYWDFYRGFGFMVSVMLAMIASLAWIASDMGKTQPREARRLSLVLTIAAAFLTWFSFTDFFAAPMLMSAIALVVLIAATVALGREAADLSETEVSR